MKKNFFIKKSSIYVAFGSALGISIFQSFFTPIFYNPDGFSIAGLAMSAIVGILSVNISATVGRRLNALDDEPEFWNFEFRRWIFPFIVVALVVPAIGHIIGIVLQGSPLLIVALTMCNFLLNPLAYCILTARILKNRLAHVFFSALLTWLISAPLHLIYKQPLQIWFAVFPVSALLAITGYLAAQGTKAIRSRAVGI
ncbi:hypothetical protein [Pandoraea sp. NPDC090278]|uniref:hypothetical protein n=1 Tax=Pandoraea sp. NPDC090278 TaxID=3364391 RepID=UPI00383B9925